jgi:hypothetical protein
MKKNGEGMESRDCVISFRRNSLYRRPLTALVLSGRAQHQLSAAVSDGLTARPIIPELGICIIEERGKQNIFYPFFLFTLKLTFMYV